MDHVIFYCQGGKSHYYAPASRMWFAGKSHYYASASRMWVAMSARGQVRLHHLRLTCQCQKSGPPALSASGRDHVRVLILQE